MELKRRNIISYSTWKEWDKDAERYKWCMTNLIGRMLVKKTMNFKLHQDETHNWLFE